MNTELRKLSPKLRISPPDTYPVSVIKAVVSEKIYRGRKRTRELVLKALENGYILYDGRNKVAYQMFSEICIDLELPLVIVDKCEDAWNLKIDKFHCKENQISQEIYKNLLTAAQKFGLASPSEKTPADTRSFLVSSKNKLEILKLIEIFYQ